MMCFFLSQFIFGENCKICRCGSTIWLLPNASHCCKFNLRIAKFFPHGVSKVVRWFNETMANGKQKDIIALSIGRWKLTIKSIYGKVENRKRKYPNYVLTDKSIHTRLCVHSLSFRLWSMHSMERICFMQIVEDVVARFRCFSDSFEMKTCI